MKKKTIAAFGLFVASSVLILIHSATANAQLLDQSFSVSALASSLKNPQDVARYIWRHFSFETDRRQFGKENYWQSAEEIMKNQKGDCEDFAMFAKQILESNGYSAFILNYYGGRKDHSICVFKYKGKYGAVDGGNFVAASFKDLRSLLDHMDPFWKNAAVVTDGGFFSVR